MAGNGKTPNFNWDTVPADGSLGENGNKALVADRIHMDSVVYSMVNHKHNGFPIVPEDISGPPDVEIDDYPGTIVGGQWLYYKIALVDSDGREGNASESVPVYVPNAVVAPTAPTVATSITGGDLLGGAYQHALTAYNLSNPNSETEPSRAVYANVLPTTHGKVTLTYPALPAGASGWNIYRHAFNELDFLRIDAVSSANADLAGGVFVDDGSYVGDTNRRLPTVNNTNRNNSALITFPDVSVPEGYTWKVYRTSVDGFWANSLLYNVEELDDDDNVVTEFLDTGYPAFQGSPIEGMPLILNPDPLDLDTETVGTLPLSRVEHQSVVLEQDDGFVDIAYEDPANLYYVELSEDGTFVVPDLEDERSFVLVVKSTDPALPVMAWALTDGTATPDIDEITPIWYGSNPFEEDEIPADGVMILVNVVQTGPTARHLALSWLAGSTGTGETPTAVGELVNLGALATFEISETFLSSMVGVIPDGSLVTIFETDAGDPLPLGLYSVSSSGYELVRDLFGGEFEGQMTYAFIEIVDEMLTTKPGGFYLNSSDDPDGIFRASRFVDPSETLVFDVPLRAEFNPATGDALDLVNRDAYDALVTRLELLEVEVFGP